VRNGPNKIQHQQDKEIWLAKIEVFPIVARKDERSAEQLVSHQEINRVVSHQDAGEPQVSFPGIVKRSR
jgi:hypothetical protein